MAQPEPKPDAQPVPPSAGFEPIVIEFEFDDPADAEHVLLGLLVARTNNSNPLFQDFIDALNEGLEDWRRNRLLAEQAVRSAHS